MTHEIGVSGYVEKGLLHKSLESVFAGSSLQIAGAFAGEGIDKHADYAAQLEESLEAEKFLASMVTIFVTTRGFVYGPQSYCLPHVLNTRGWSTVVCWFWEFWTNRSFVVCMSIFSRLGNSERLCIELLKIYAVILENWLLYPRTTSVTHTFRWHISNCQDDDWFFSEHKHIRYIGTFDMSMYNL